MKSAYSLRRPVENVYLVRERDRRRRWELLRAMAVALPLVAGVLAHVWISHELLETGYRMRALEQRLEGLKQEERRLQVETAHLARPARVEALAVEELGMRPASIDQTVFAEELP